MGQEDLPTTLIPESVNSEGFNDSAELPYGLTVGHVRSAMEEFVGFLGFMNQQAHERGIERLETLMDPAGFSGLVGGFTVSEIPKHCPGLARNNYHHGHPDMLPVGRYPGDSAQYEHEGIEVKASRRTSGWQGHNPEHVWLMVFVYDSNKPSDLGKDIPPRQFRFVEVLGAQLTEDDWSFSGRGEESRRTITASIVGSGREKLRENWIYRAPRLK